MEVPGSFEAVGHIAHLNLKEPALPYKHLIAQVGDDGGGGCCCAPRSVRVCVFACAHVRVHCVP